ncbi:flagellar L-ring protein 1 [Kordiimonas sediminis]|uniref:Flagellar L-ring protein n=1 Tax=Kordiimonas sediminis TaxID=1735581 RepID=A0A919EAT0_9PROT|nr:flagellar basal body L-ring protein FlgH [Kordiimonas sediminis]GHF29397.1 flagellar L-ring protein 1 [Kordiimonas sediminis]
MVSKTVKNIGTVLSLSMLAACSNLDRIGEIGKKPEITPIQNVNAPEQQRSIGVPIPSRDMNSTGSNSLWRTGARAFFKDQRAGRIGDIVTVQINISDQAQIGNTTARSRSTSEDAGLDNFFGLEQAIPNLYTSGGAAATGSDATVRNAFDPSSMVGFGSTNNYEGTGTVDRSESISMTVAAIVTDVLPNGNLVIQGRQEVRVNYERRDLLVAGVIRPEDISSGNTISHSQIAELRLDYGGKGQLTDVQQPRYGTQLYDIIFPF